MKKTTAYKTDPRAVSPTRGQALANSLTHGIGALLSVAGIVFLALRAARRGTGWHLAGFLVFGFSLFLLYLASAAYHSAGHEPRKALLQRLDHAAIFVLIAGTYTPFIFTQMRDGLGWAVFGIIWAAAILVFVLKLALRKGFEKPPVALYLAAGWLGVVVLFQTIGKIGAASLWLLLAGGIFYSAGVIFYRWRNLPYNHAVWHIFVLLGSASHYFSVMYLA